LKRKQMSEALHHVAEAKRLQATALDAAANAIVITDRDGIVKWANSAYGRLTGFTPAEALGKNPRILKSGKHSQTFYKELWDTILGGRIWHGELINKRKDGTLYTEEQTITPVRDEHGEISHFISIKQDVTQRKRTEEELKALTEGLEKRVAARSKELVASRNAALNMMQDAEEARKEAVQAAAALRKHREHLEERVAERTAELEAANKELEAFAYSVSHDLRGPLRAIDGFSQILLEECTDRLDAEGQRLLQVVRDNTNLMGQLIEDILELSRVGRSAIEPARIDMREAVAAAVRQAQQQHADHELPIKVHDLPAAVGDERLIRQVWTNLLTNAVKFTANRESPVIEVRGVADNSEHVYSVTDNGTGFDMQYAGKLFNLFQRLHTREEFEGTGVGLAIVKRIVERHGGRVWAEGKIDEGATFYFTMPNTGI
jgi:PAS domain S-box-containing protein